MRAVLLRQTGDADVLQLQDIEPPQPGEGEVLVRIHAVSTNPIEFKQRRGTVPKQLPAVLGSDISGTVEVSHAQGFTKGDDVFGFAASGGYAELAGTPATLLAHKPPELSHTQAAAIPVAGLTAWQALFDHGGLQRGQSALIAGAGGGVGHFAVQLAKHAGARVIGTGSQRSRDFVLGLGADEFVDYTSQDVAEAVHDVDVAFDTVGGETTQTLIPTVREGGSLITIAGTPPEQEAAARGVHAQLLVMRPNSGQLAQIAKLVADGELRVQIAETLALADVRRAHELSESGRTHGKIVLDVSG